MMCVCNTRVVRAAPRSCFTSPPNIACSSSRAHHLRPHITRLALLHCLSFNIAHLSTSLACQHRLSFNIACPSTSLAHPALLARAASLARPASLAVQHVVPPEENESKELLPGASPPPPAPDIHPRPQRPHKVH